MRVFSTLMPRSNENKSCMRVKKREFVWEFLNSHALVSPRTRVAWELRSKSLHELMRVKKQEFAWEFSQLSCPGQTRTRVAWELRSESLHESFLNSHAPVKREQELHESWEARVCMRVFSTLMPWSVREQELHESWEARVCMRVVELRSESCMRVDESSQARVYISHALVKREQELHESWEQELHESWLRVEWILPATTSISNSHPQLTILKFVIKGHGISSKGRGRPQR
jgi:hypothetical protein